MISSGTRRHKEKVYLNVYDLQPEHNTTLYAFGFGYYHSGVQVHGTEITFGQGGIFEHSPKAAGQASADAPGSCVYRETVLIGETDYTSSEIQSKLLPKLKEELGFIGSNYNVMKKNCNHFADALCGMLLKKQGSTIPGWVNRMASWGSFFYGGGQQGQQAPAAEAAPQQSTFGGKGRTLSGKVISEKGKVSSPGTTGGSWFSWFSKPSTPASSTNNTTTTSSTAPVSKASPASVAAPKATSPRGGSPTKKELTPEERRQKMLQATMARMQQQQ